MDTEFSIEYINGGVLKSIDFMHEHVLYAKTNELTRLCRKTENGLQPFGFPLSEKFRVISLKELYKWQIVHKGKEYRIWDLLKCKKPKFYFSAGLRVVEIYSEVLNCSLAFW